MKQILIFMLLLTVTHFSMAQDTNKVAAVLDALHSAASKADSDTYFNLFADDAIFIGTDAEEFWSLEQFKSYTMPYFSKGQGWTYVPKNRDIKLSQSGDVAWFHEILNSKSYGTTRGTGVLVLGEDKEWKIAQYHLTIPIPNDLAKEFADKIKIYESEIPTDLKE
jgi:ketosteroid isomerase-like protein